MPDETSAGQEIPGPGTSPTLEIPHLVAVPEAREASRREGITMLHQAALKLGLTAGEFLERWDAGKLDRADPAVTSVAMLIPFAREEPA